jgi:hypothetical protein
MLKIGDSKRRLGIMLVVLAVFVVGITATGYADPLGPTERLSGPAVVGTLVVIGSTVTFDGHCRGNPATFTASITTTPGSLEGLRLNSIASSVCRDQPSSDVIVKNVVNDVSTTPKVVLLWVVSQ